MQNDCSRLTVVELKDRLQQFGLDINGNKSDLCSRLQSYYQDHPEVAKLNSRYRPEYGVCELDEEGNVIDPISTSVIEPDNIITIIEGNKTFCFDINTIRRIVETQQQPSNPFTNKPFSPELIRQVREVIDAPSSKTADLIRAIRTNNYPEIDALLRTMIPDDLNRVWSNDTPLTALISHNFPRDIIERALKAGANPNMPTIGLNGEDIYPIQIQETLRILRLLIQYGADINVQNVSQDTLLDILLRRSHLNAELIKTLVEAGATLPPGILDRIPPDNARILIQMLDQFDIPHPTDNRSVEEKLEYLLSFDTAEHIRAFLHIQNSLGNKINLNARLPHSSLRPIQFVIQKRPNDLGLIRLLLSYNVQIQPEDIANAPPVTKQFLRNAIHERLDKDLLTAVINEDLPQVQILLRQGASITNFPNNNEEEKNALIASITFNRPEITEFLLEHASLTSDQLEDALIEIANSGRDPILANIIIGRGIDPTVALIHALDTRLYGNYGDYGNIYPMIRYLIDIGADPGLDPSIVYAAFVGRDFSLANQLLDAGVPITEDMLRTVTDVEVISYDVIKTLLDRDININVDNGLFIRSLAKITGDTHIQEMLAMGANVGLEDALYNYINRYGNIGKNINDVLVLINAGADPLANNWRVIRRVVEDIDLPPEIREYFIQKYPVEVNNIIREYYRRHD